MYLHIQKIKFPMGKDDVLLFETLSPKLDLFLAVHGAVAEYDRMNGKKFDGSDYADLLLAVWDVPDDLCARYGFRLIRKLTFDYAWAKKEKDEKDNA